MASIEQAPVHGLEASSAEGRPLDLDVLEGDLPEAWRWLMSSSWRRGGSSSPLLHGSGRVEVQHFAASGGGGTNDASNLEAKLTLHIAL